MSVAKAAFWTLAALVLLNLNGAAWHLFGVKRMFSPAILLCCLVLIAAGVRYVPLRRALGAPGLVLVSALALYIWIGALVALATGMDRQVDFYSYLQVYTLSIVMIVATAFGTSMVLRETEIDRLLAGILVLLSITCVVVLMSPVLDAYVYLITWESGLFRLYGTFDANDAGFAGCMTAALAMCLLHADRWRRLAYPALSLGTAAAVGSVSRTAIIALVCLFVFFLVSDRGGRKRFLGWLAVMSLGAVVVWTALDLGHPAQALDSRTWWRLETLLDSAREMEIGDNLLSNREPLWSAGLEIIAGSPVFGAGLGALHELDNVPIPDLDPDPTKGVHNQYLLFMGDAGVVPLVLFLLFFALMSRSCRMRRDLPAANVVQAWILLVALFCLTSHTVLTNRLLEFLLGASCAIMAPEARRFLDRRRHDRTRLGPIGRRGSAGAGPAEPARTP